MPILIHKNAVVLSPFAGQTAGSHWAWGSGSNGRLWDNSTSNQNSPVQSVPGDTTWVRTSLGNTAAIGIKSDGTLWAGGYNGSGQCGQGHTTTPILSPVQIGSAKNWTDVGGSSHAGSAINASNELYTWGYNGQGGVGDGTTTNRSNPTQIAGSWKRVNQYALNFMFAINTADELYAWGDNANGELGDGTTTTRSSPVQIAGSWLQAEGGMMCSTGIKTDGTLWTWGYNGYGQLGQGNTTDRSSPVQVGSATNWRYCFAGGWSTGAINTSNELWLVGRNSAGQLGVGDITGRSSPVQCAGAWAYAAMGNSGIAGIKTAGSLWSWGNGYVMADGTAVAKSSPVQVGVATDWKKDYPSVLTFGRTSGQAIREV